MDDINPPNYEELTGKTSPNTSFTNPGYLPDEGFLKPPTAPPQEFVSPERKILEKFHPISPEEIREACFQYASESCCYGTKFVRDTLITNVNNGCAYHYRLETYGEKRESCPQTTPFKGQPIDGPENGPPPNPWDIYIPITKLFVDDKKSTEVPHTAFVKQCHVCVGNCRVRCSSCSGRGSKDCSSCSGSGRSGDDSCTWCSGFGSESCSWCSGSGQVKCDKCDGQGNLKHFIKLIITWENHVSDFVSDTSNLPKEQILEVTGREILKEEQVKAYPINHCTDPSVNHASVELLAMHERSFPNELARMQRQTLRAVPLTKARYFWKEKQGEFYVFGIQNKVYFEDYPQKCCCCTCC